MMRVSRWGVPPPLRAVGRASGRTFEFAIALPEPANAGGRPPNRAKQAGKIPRKATPKAQTKPCPEPSAAGVESNQEELPEFEQKSGKTAESRERVRLRAKEQHREAKELGRCKGCSNQAIPQQSRCQQCAEKHRVSRRKWQAQRRSAKDKRG